MVWIWIWGCVGGAGAFFFLNTALAWCYVYGLSAVPCKWGVVVL